MPAKRRPVCLCHDRILEGEAKRRAMALACKENPANAPAMPRRLTGVSMSFAKMALFAGKRWANGRTLRCRFLDGSETQRRRVMEHAVEWTRHANIGFDFNASRWRSDIRISFGADRGSWSYIGTDCLAMGASQATMNFGWLKDDTDDTEFRRVVLHEFGHALGCIHEHQNPRGGIKWNEEAVYRHYGGPPNNWARDYIRQHVIEKYMLDQLNAEEFDPDSIMLYSYPAELLASGRPTPLNTVLSARDMRFIASIYPKGG
jgi:hypothetical protein